ncbi:hypothetical protein KKB64_01935 [Patescibacteria group bacterium]|nr:hypothetical protein [Patescibacteria group bacterium]MBU1472532.1 hypothetical protein [Patescibacteria group bacterium]MBU2460095.1 hypothetical protein [Patescibacteria group bacterium]MBU2544664.1 hypothetical protein [Patescibacteria group bacterium]
MTDKEKLIGKNGHGIPLDVLAISGSGDIPGTNLRYLNSRHDVPPLISIFNPDGAFFRGEINDVGIASFSIRSRLNNILLDPDLFGAELMVAFLRKYEDKIKCVRTEWSPYSVNYEEYFKRLNAYHSQYSELDSAALTWTGRTIGKLGYKPVRISFDYQDYHDEPSWIVVYFEQVKLRLTG